MKSISAKKLASLNGVVPFSSITSPRKAIKKSLKRIRAVNPEAETKRRKTRKRNHAAYRASETFKLVQQRAAGQCEGSLRWARTAAEAEYRGVDLIEIGDGMEWMANGAWVRCGETEDLEHHHVRYPNEPGTERPEDICILGQRCHGWIETVNHPTRKNGRSHV